MREMRQYSNQTIRLAAQRVRRAMDFIRHPGITHRDKLDALVGQLVKLHWQPRDVARPNGEAALIAIAEAIPKPRYTRSPVVPDRMLVIDSFVVHDEVVYDTVRPPHAWMLVIKHILRTL